MQALGPVGECAAMFDGDASVSLPSPCIGASRMCMMSAAEHCGAFSREGCHTAEKDDACFEHIRWAMQIGIVAHPEEYPGLRQESSFEDIQTMLHERGLHNCTAPCSRLPDSLCHTAVEDEECFVHTMWAIEKGTDIFPLWYPVGILKEDTRFEDFQAWLHEIHHGSCPKPCQEDRELSSTVPLSNVNPEPATFELTTPSPTGSSMPTAVPTVP